jgi:hypothetical protein
MTKEEETLLRRYYEDVILKPGFGFNFSDLTPADKAALKMSSGFIYYKLGAASKELSEETFKKLRQANREIKEAS